MLSFVFTCFNIDKPITSQVNLVLTSQEIVEVLLREIEEYHLFGLQISECRRWLTMVESGSPSKITSGVCSMVLLAVDRQHYKTGKEDN